MIQALYDSHETAEQMHYLEKKLSNNLRGAQARGGTFELYDNTACGRELLDVWEDGRY